MGLRDRRKGTRDMAEWRAFKRAAHIELSISADEVCVLEFDSGNGSGSAECRTGPVAARVQSGGQTLRYLEDAIASYGVFLEILFSSPCG